jgi:hypothetical protein
MTNEATPGNQPRIWMLIIGAIALLAGGLYTWNGYRDATAAQVIYDAFPTGLHADFTKMWIGIAVAAVGLILLFTVWVIRASQK